jgi:hypothetical protein
MGRVKKLERRKKTALKTGRHPKFLLLSAAADRNDKWEVTDKVLSPLTNGASASASDGSNP